jgi:hypothetical protein
MLRFQNSCSCEATCEHITDSNAFESRKPKDNQSELMDAFRSTVSARRKSARSYFLERSQIPVSAPNEKRTWISW